MTKFKFTRQSPGYYEMADPNNGNYIVHSLDNRRGVIYIKRVATETLK